MEKKEYFIGLDCGTDSVGFAVTDTEYNLLKFNGKAMWGSRLFDAANTAQERRTNRAARRRHQREKQRIGWTQEMFADEIGKIDPLFFIRLNDSFYRREDKKINQSNALFDDPAFKDKDFFKRYPTIYHLRFALMHSNDPADFDPRYVYLAIAHIMRHRGHFLFPGSNLSAIRSIDAPLSELEQLLSDALGISCEFMINKERIEAALLEHSRGKKKSLFAECIVVEDKNIKDLLIKMLCGNKAKLCKLFDNENYKELPDVEFSKSSFEEADLPVIEDAVSDDEYQIILLVKALYDWSLLISILPSKPNEDDNKTDASYWTIANAKCMRFEQNKKDLADLKAAVKKYAPSQYNSFFHGTGTAANFVAYIGKDHDEKLVRKNKQVRVRKCSTEDFYKAVTKLLESAPEDDEIVSRIRTAIEDKSFLVMLQSSLNSVIPNQIIKTELDLILKNASRFLPLLSQVDESGKSVAEKLSAMVSFRIDYFVGPLGSNPNNKNVWAVRAEQGTIYPWNFKDKIDLAASGEEFIKRMTNKCTYFHDQDVLPKNSLLYSSYLVLNDLNNVRINRDLLTIEQKQTIYNELFGRRKQVTQKALKDFVFKKGWYEKGRELEISGIDGDFKSSLKPYIDFWEFLDSGILSPSEVEEIIRWLTIFEEGGSLLEAKIKDKYGEKLGKDGVKNILKLKYSGWGRFSKKLLNGIVGTDHTTGEMKSIIRLLWDTQDNLMQLLGKGYDFYDQIEDNSVFDRFSYDMLEDLYVSPSVKRQIWQTLRVVDEIVSIMKAKPKKVFIEVARGPEDEKKRTVSRKNSLLAAMKGLDPEYKQIIANLEGTDENLVSRRDKLYLYFTQLGKCMYTGKPIDIEDLDNTNLYDIDHIYPISKSNDDSLTNRVLVDKTINEHEKKDIYPIGDNIRARMAGFWKELNKRGLINDEKYYRLTRSTPFSEGELEGFVSRQLVETRQSTKATASILKRYFGDETKIVYSKAGPVADFRKEKGFVKCRSINDLHHAKDAYINIVVGNVLDVKYSSDFWKSPKYGNGYYNIHKPFENSVEGAWTIEGNKSLAIVSRTMSKNNILLTRQPVTRNGALFDLMPVKAGGNGLLPTKMDERLIEKIANSEKGYEAEIADWTGKYGGYNKVSVSHFAVIQYSERKKTYTQFLPIRIVDRDKLDTVEKIRMYCEIVLGYKGVSVLRTKVLINSSIEVDGFRMLISGVSGSKILLKSMTPLILDEESVAYVKNIEKYNDLLSKSRGEYTIDEKHDGLCWESNLRLYKILTAKACNSTYEKRLNNQSQVFSESVDKFSRLALSEQIAVLTNMLSYFSGGGLCDLSALKNGSGKYSGLLAMSERMKTGDKSVCIVDQSVTGLFESKIKLT